MRTTLRRVLAHTLACVGVAAATSCSRPSPVSPTPAVTASQAAPLASSPSGSSRKKANVIAADTATFPLVAGSFTAVNADGDSLNGTYTGTARVAVSTSETAYITLRVSDGSGAFAGASGTMIIAGTGAFTGEGDFVLDGRGEVMLPGGRRALLVLSLRGTAAASCSTSGRIAIAQSAEGTLTRAGRVTATLSHEVEYTGCGS